MKADINPSAWVLINIDGRSYAHTTSWQAMLHIVAELQTDDPSSIDDYFILAYDNDGNRLGDPIEVVGLPIPSDNDNPLTERTHVSDTPAGQEGEHTSGQTELDRLREELNDTGAELSRAEQDMLCVCDLLGTDVINLHAAEDAIRSLQSTITRLRQIVSDAQPCVAEALNNPAHSWHGSDTARKWLIDASSELNAAKTDDVT